MKQSAPTNPESCGQALPIGTRLEEFQIEQIMGSGGFGITYLALDTRLGRRVVIKENLPVQFCYRDTRSMTVAPRHTQGEDIENFQWSLENFSREAATLASLDHPGIVRVLRSWEAFGTAYFAMPYLEGVTLDEWLLARRGGGPIPEHELRSLQDHLLDALDHIHARGIYHRDIKPGNILVTKQGSIVLIDFGSARQRIGERSMTVVESAGYTPFEQLQSRGDVGPWSDLYSLGATLTKAITGETPPKATDRVIDDPWPGLLAHPAARTYSRPFLAAIERAMAVSSKARWRSAGEWRNGGGEAAAASAPQHVASVPPPAVAARTQEESYSARPRPLSEVPPPSKRKAGKRGAANPLAQALLALLVVGVAVGTGWWALGRSGDSSAGKFGFLDDSGAPQGPVNSAARMGYNYYEGIGVPKDGPLAYHWFSQAAGQGDAEGEFGVGLCYEIGSGVNIDYKEAKKWFDRAARKKHAKAAQKLGAFYEGGWGTPKDETTAFMWYRIAADSGIANAEDLKRITGKLSRSEQETAKQMVADWKASHP